MDAMKMVGVDVELANTQVFKKRMLKVLEGMLQVAKFTYNDEALKAWSVFIVETARFNMDGKSKLKMVKALRLARCSEEHLKGHLYLCAIVKRQLKKRMRVRVLWH
jgi:hypothetical protein